MKLFKGQNLLEFADRFQTDEDCMKYLAHLKWVDGYNLKSVFKFNNDVK